MDVIEPDGAHVDDTSKVEKSGDQNITKPKLKRVSSKIGGGVRVRPAPSCNVRSLDGWVCST